MVLHEILIITQSDWTTVQILNEGVWYVGEKVNEQEGFINLAGAGVQSLRIEPKTALVSKQQFDATMVRLRLFVKTEDAQKDLVIRIRKGDMQYTRVESAVDTAENDVNVAGDWANQLEFTLALQRTR